MEILNYSEQPPGQSLMAIFSVQTKFWTLHKVKLFRSKKGGFLISLPSYSEEKPDGTKNWFPFLEFSEEKEREFKNSILEIIKAMVK